MAVLLKYCLFLFRVLACVLATFVIVELFLHQVLSPTIEYGLWFSKGAHTPDKKYGFVFTKNFKGAMRHQDQVFYMPLNLNRNGFRQTVLSSQGPNPAAVVFIGGRSQMFGYGLHDDETIPAQVAGLTTAPIAAYNTAWPGFNIFLNLMIYRDLLEDEISPSIAVISFYGYHPAAFDSYLPDDSVHYINSEDYLNRGIETFHAAPKDLFKYNVGLAVKPRGRIAAALGPFYYRSMLIYKLDRLVSTISRIFHQYKRRLIDPNALDAPIPEDTRIKRGEKKFKQMVHYITTYFKKRNVQLLFVFLPLRRRPQDTYCELKAMIPPTSCFIDLHSELFGQIEASEFIAGGHYNNTHTGLIGKKIAIAVDQMLK